LLGCRSVRELKLSDISLYCIVKDLQVNFWIVILCAVMAVMGTEIVTIDLRQLEYVSTATFYVNAKDGSYSAYEDLGMSSATALVLCEVFESNIMARKAAESIGLDYLDADITANVTPNTNLLSLTATAASPIDAFIAVRAIMNNHDKVSSHVFDNVVIEILDLPTVPVSPDNYFNLRPAQTIAAAAAIILALIMILVLSVLRSTVKTSEGLKHLLNARLLAVLPYINKKRNHIAVQNNKHMGKALVITDSRVGFVYSEAIEMICSKLEYISENRGHRVFLITSARENEGKSTVSANIALNFARRGYKVLLVDADLRKPAQFKILDKQNAPFLDFSQVLTGKATPVQAIQYDERTGLYLLLNKQENLESGDLISSPGMVGLMEYYHGIMDYIIVDSPPVSTVSDTEALLNLCDASLLVVRQDFTDNRMLNDTIDKLRTKDFMGCIFNTVKRIRFAGSFEEKRYGNYYKKA
jgi:capsular exopolysaccharide synthesis family protein